MSRRTRRTGVRERRPQLLQNLGNRRDVGRKERRSTVGCGDVSTPQHLSQFNFIWEDSTIETLDIASCVSILRVRRKSEYGVNKLAKLMNRSEDNRMGHTSAAALPIVSEIPRDQFHLVEEHFREDMGICAEKAREQVHRDGQSWYAIVDGDHRHDALLLEASKNPSEFAGFPWQVIVIKWRQSRVLKAFARNRNRMQESEYLVEMTLYDTVRALKDLIVEEVLECGPLSDYKSVVNTRGFNKRVAAIYSGCMEYSDSTLEKLVGVVKTLSSETVEALGDITTVEDPALMRARAQQTDGANDDSSLKMTDARMYKNLISASTLRGATFFRDAKPELQILALQRLKNRFRLNSYRGFSAESLNAETRKAGLALAEKEKMERAMGSKVWHRDMRNIVVNLLQTNTFDEEVEEFRNINGEIIPSLELCYKKTFPQQAPIRLALFKADSISGTTEEDTQINRKNRVADVVEDEEGGAESESSGPNRLNGVSVSCRQTGPYSDVSDADTDDELDAAIVAENGHRGTAEVLSPAQANQPHATSNIEIERDNIVDGCRAQPAVSDDDSEIRINQEHNEADESLDSDANQPERDVLRNWNIHALRATPREYVAQHFTPDSDLYDVYMGDPTQVDAGGRKRISLTTEDIDGHIQAARKLLRPGAVFMLFTTAYDFKAWFDALTAAEFTPLPYPFIIVRDECQTQATRTKRPQNIAELMVIAYAPGVHPKGFVANTDTPYPQTISTFHRKWALMNKAPVPQFRSKLTRPGTRSPLRPMQRSAAAISELLETFCPPKGNVLDVQAGAMETGEACMITKRRCTLLETEKVCYDVARESLKRTAIIFEEKDDQRRKIARRNHGTAQVEGAHFGESPSLDRLGVSVEEESTDNDSAGSEITRELRANESQEDTPDELNGMNMLAYAAEAEDGPRKILGGQTKAVSDEHNNASETRVPLQLRVRL